MSATKDKDTNTENAEIRAEKKPIGLKSRMEEKVPIKLFRDGKAYKDDLVITVNGKAYQIKRGVEVMVPRYVAEIIDSHERQMNAANELSAKNQADFERNRAYLE